MKRFLLLLGIAILGFAAGSYTYFHQKSKTDMLRNQVNSLQTQLTLAQVTYNAAKAASVVKTDSWKPYCDPLAPLCFKYPENWKLDAAVTDYGDGYKRGGATLTNNDKTATVSYIDPLVKDGSSGSAHIVDESQIIIANQKLELVGSYPVSSGRYDPWYFYANSAPAIGGTPGSIGHDLSSSIFDINTHQDLSFSGRYSGTTTLTSQAQAEAWFQSVNGKTVKAILASLTTQ